MTFGAFSSRFWGLRKHINSLNEKQILALPYYSWECISLKTKHREVDLVFKDQRLMNKLVLHLLRSLKTVDGHRGSAIPILLSMDQNDQEDNELELIR